jgi:hypothetical protein
MAHDMCGCNKSAHVVHHFADRLTQSVRTWTRQLIDRWQDSAKAPLLPASPPTASSARTTRSRRRRTPTTTTTHDSADALMHPTLTSPALRARYNNCDCLVCLSETADEFEA